MKSTGGKLKVCASIFRHFGKPRNVICNFKPTQNKMDIYKENFEKGAEHYINLLNEINWFDNPYVDK